LHELSDALHERQFVSHERAGCPLFAPLSENPVITPTAAIRCRAGFMAVNRHARL